MTGQTAERVGVVVIHGVGETEAGWINEYLIPNLQKQESGLEFQEHSEVHRLPDLGRSRPGILFKAYLRRSQLRAAQDVTFMELFWADLSRVGTGRFSNFLVMLQLFYEAPLILGAAFLSKRQTGMRGILNSVIRIANWLIRWPITGLNTAVFVCASGLLVVQKLREIAAVTPKVAAYLAFSDIYTVCMLLVLLAAAALWFARRNVHRGILLTDLALSTAISSALLLILAVFAGLFIDPAKMQGPAPYLWFAAWPILSLWWVWNHLVAAGVVLLLVMALAKAVSPRGLKLKTLMRPASALGLSTIQGTIWKIFITIGWVLLISVLDPRSVNFDQCQGETAKYCSFLYELNPQLLGIFFMNLTLAFSLGLGGLAIIGIRNMVVRTRRKSLLAGHSRLPRLIVSPWLIILMFAMTIVNFFLYFVPLYNKLLQGSFGISIPLIVDVGELTRKTFFDNGLVASVAGSASLLLLLIFFRTVQKASRGVLHIVRDLVDHQYTPEFTLSGFMLPKRQRFRDRYPRRERIQKRFDALMELIDKGDYQRLILVAHSQGTVILHDYLRSNRDDKTLKKTKRIDIVTLGSPLGHFYQHYFPSYESITMSAERLNPRLQSWLNLYRIDDPIGAKVEVVSGNFIVNKALPAGGHIDYWKEPQVCSAILDLIDPARVKPVTGPQTASAAQTTNAA